MISFDITDCLNFQICAGSTDGELANRIWLLDPLRSVRALCDTSFFSGSERLLQATSCQIRF